MISWRNCIFAANYNFQIPISSEPDGVNLQTEIIWSKTLGHKGVFNNQNSISLWRIVDKNSISGIGNQDTFIHKYLNIFILFLEINLKPFCHALN